VSERSERGPSGPRSGEGVNGQVDVPVDPPLAAVRDVVARGLAEDLGSLGDVTALALVDADQVGEGRFVSRQPGVLAGTLCATEAFAQLDPAVTVAWELADGATLEAGTCVGVVEGPLRALLTGERTALNLLCHLSGIATLTRRLVDAVAAAGCSTIVVDTRKTLPGLRALQKAAVRAGGGRNHRESLSDAVLVKDNHLRAIGIAEAVRRARAMWPGRGVEIECDTLEQVAEAVAAGADIVMCDNMTAPVVAEAVAIVGGRALVEVSGGVGIDTIADLARAGADLVSVGALTHSAPSLDLGLDLD
jgi:nicotinate-nucleotide pyrophosphorylase (carboxylating)